jgi:hypothetical protein
MATALRAGIAYFLIVFAIGFVLGTVRVLVVAPQFGATHAVLIELPIMLTASWIACAWLVRRFKVAGEFGARLVMGAFALALLMAGELAVSLFAFGRTVEEHFTVYGTLDAQLGLAAQLLFAAFLLIQVWAEDGPRAWTRRTWLAIAFANRPVFAAPAAATRYIRRVHGVVLHLE